MACLCLFTALSDVQHLECVCQSVCVGGAIRGANASAVRSCSWPLSLACPSGCPASKIRGSRLCLHISTLPGKRSTCFNLCFAALGFLVLLQSIGAQVLTCQAFDGLKCSWQLLAESLGRVYLNPPWSQLDCWLHKANQSGSNWQPKRSQNDEIESSKFVNKK